MNQPLAPDTCRTCAALSTLPAPELAALPDFPVTRRLDAFAWGAAHMPALSQHALREHLAHLKNNPVVPGTTNRQEPLFPDERDVLTAIDEAADAATPTTVEWLNAQGIDTPPGLVAATVKTEDGHWLRVKPETAASALAEADVADLRNRIHSWARTPRVTRTRSQATPTTLLVCWADWQLGKGEGGGVDATIKRITDGIEKTAERVEELRSLGRNIERVAVANMGDPTEGCEGNYAQQLFTIELNLRDQLLLALDMWLLGIRTLAPLAPGFSFASVLCNHGELSRRGGKNVTDNADNAGGLLADTARRVLDGRPEYGHIDWTVARDEMILMPTFSGVPVGLTHGHTISGKEDAWLNSQSIRLLREHKTEPKLWVTAHRHHLAVADFGAYTRIQCPSNDGGSEWYTNSSGKWSTPGTLTMLVGEHDPRGFSDLQLV